MDLRYLRRVIAATILLKCPRCGHGPVFKGFFKMYSECLRCRLQYEREQGFFVGAIYLNYAATVLIAVPGYFVLDYFTGISLSHQLLLWGGFSIVFPLVFFRHSRSLWLGLVYLLSPEETRGPRLKRIV